MKTTTFCLLCLTLAYVSAHASDDDGMQAQTDSMTGAIMSPADEPRPKGRLDSPEQDSPPVSGVKPAADPEPRLRQGPVGSTMVETPDYMGNPPILNAS